MRRDKRPGHERYVRREILDWVTKSRCSGSCTNESIRNFSTDPRLSGRHQKTFSFFSLFPSHSVRRWLASFLFLRPSFSLSPTDGRTDGRTDAQCTQCRQRDVHSFVRSMPVAGELCQGGHIKATLNSLYHTLDLLKTMILNSHNGISVRPSILN